MMKMILPAVAVVALAGLAFTMVADAQDAGPAGNEPRALQPGFIFDAKVAGMKTELKLTPDQEKLWPAFEAAVREAHAQRLEMGRERRERMEKSERPSPIQVMTDMSDNLAKASTELKKVADAAKPLYDSFDDGQKRRFGPLLMMLRQEPPRPWGRGEHAERASKPL
jgi:hypothetical protein